MSREGAARNNSNVPVPACLQSVVRHYYDPVTLLVISGEKLQQFWNLEECDWSFSTRLSATNALLYRIKYNHNLTFKVYLYKRNGRVHMILRAKLTMADATLAHIVYKAEVHFKEINLKISKMTQNEHVWDLWGADAVLQSELRNLKQFTILMYDISALFQSLVPTSIFDDVQTAKSGLVFVSQNLIRPGGPAQTGNHEAHPNRMCPANALENGVTV